MNKLQQLEEAVNAIPLFHLRAVLRGHLENYNLHAMCWTIYGAWLTVVDTTSDESVLEPIRKVRDLLTN